MRINDNPISSEKELLQALEKLFNGKEEFIVLGNDSAFIQTEGYLLEYYNPQTQVLYQTTDTEIPHEQIKQAMLSYYHENDEYKTMFQWQELKHQSLWESLKSFFAKFFKRTE